ncbi:MAG: class I SAM-dependent methyltransferase [Candidatus Omnitrophica bacterium]|nr:class I SAM-dependent methyltransferase [Candidatus Omnitrophota bacterium]
MNRLPEQFKNSGFEDKIKAVRSLEAQRDHQGDMYKKPLNAKRREMIKSLLKEFVKQKKFMEIGCAEGFYCGCAAEYGALSVTGIDLVAKKLNEAKRRYPGCKFALADATKIAIDDDKFDLILCSEVLQHLVDYDECLNRACGLLKPGGILVISVPNLSLSSEHEFANVSEDMEPEELLHEIGGASYGKQNALWKFNTEKLSEEISSNYPLQLIDFIKVGAPPLKHQTAAQAENIFTILVYKRRSD